MMTQLLSRFAVTAVQTQCNAAHDFFGMTAWYAYLPQKDFKTGTCDINGFTVLPNGATKSDFPLVLLAIIDDLLKIAAFAAVGFVVYGAVQYMTSQGNPDGTSKAQQTIINALIGLTVAVSAVVIVTFFGTHLAKAP